MLQLGSLSLSRRTKLLKLFDKACFLLFILFSQRFYLLGVLGIPLSELRFKRHHLGLKLVFASLELLLELLEAFGHAVLLEVGVQVVGELVEAADARCQTLRRDIQLALQGLLGSKKLLLLREQLRCLRVVLSALEPLRDLTICLIELLHEAGD